MRYLLLNLLAIALVSCDGGGTPEAPPVGDVIEAPENGNVTYVRTLVVGADASSSAVAGADDITATGSVVSDQLARPSSKTGGLLSAVLIREGDDVRRGQTIARIDATELSSGVAQAEAALAKARRDLARVEALFADSVATRTQRDDAATGVEVAERQLESLRFNRGQNVITAPISGRIVQKLANAGETVGPGMPVAVIQGTASDDWRVRVGLADAQWARTRIGQAAEVSFDAFPGQTFAATLTERATAADPASGTFPVELKLRRQPPSLAAGLVASVVLHASPTPPSVRRARRTASLAQDDGAGAASPQQRSGPFSIPIASLGRVAGKRAEVFVARGGHADAREVQLGSVRGEMVEVLTGLQAGDSLITTGVAWLRGGDAVAVVGGG